MRGHTGNLFDWNGTPVIVFTHPDGGGASCFASNPEGDRERWRFDPGNAVLRHPVQGNSLYPSSNDATSVGAPPTERAERAVISLQISRTAYKMRG